MAQKIKPWEKQEAYSRAFSMGLLRLLPTFLLIFVVMGCGAPSNKQVEDAVRDFCQQTQVDIEIKGGQRVNTILS